MGKIRSILTFGTDIAGKLYLATYIGNSTGNKCETKAGLNFKLQWSAKLLAEKPYPERPAERFNKFNDRLI